MSYIHSYRPITIPEVLYRIKNRFNLSKFMLIVKPYFFCSYFFFMHFFLNHEVMNDQTQQTLKFAVPKWVRFLLLGMTLRMYTLCFFTTTALNTTISCAHTYRIQFAFSKYDDGFYVFIFYNRLRQTEFRQAYLFGKRHGSKNKTDSMMTACNSPIDVAWNCCWRIK